MALLGRMSYHQQSEVNYLPRFSPLLICLERSPLRGDRSREIDFFENLDVVHIRLLVVRTWLEAIVEVLGCDLEARPVGGILRLTGVVLRREPGGKAPAF